MNVHAIRAIYMFEMARTWRTVMQSILAPVMTTSLYFVVFGAAIGSRMAEVDGVKYAAFIIPGLTMLSLLTESISNASFGIYMPRFSGTIYEVLSAPISFVVSTNPSGASVTRSGIVLGVTPLSFTLPPGADHSASAELTFALDGYQTVTVTAQGTGPEVSLNFVRSAPLE